MEGIKSKIGILSYEESKKNKTAEVAETFF